MTTPDPGWYPDPRDPGLIRWFDGTAWTDHTGPAPAQAPQPLDPEPADGGPPPPAAGDRDESADGGWGSSSTHGGWGTTPAGDGGWGTTPSSAGGWSSPNAPATGHGTGTGQPWTGQAGTGQPWTPPTSTSTGGSRTGLIVAVVALAVVALVGVLAAVVVTAVPGSGPEVTVSGTRLGIGDTTEGRAETDGRWSGTVVLEEDADVAVDVRGLDGFDPTVRVVGPGGEEVASNDDRGSDLREEYGGGHLDPLVEVSLPAGEHTVEVAGWAGAPGAFTVGIVPSLDADAPGFGDFGLD